MMQKPKVSQSARKPTDAQAPPKEGPVEPANKPRVRASPVVHDKMGAKVVGVAPGQNQVARQVQQAQRHGQKILQQAAEVQGQPLRPKIMKPDLAQVGAHKRGAAGAPDSGPERPGISKLHQQQNKVSPAQPFMDRQKMQEARKAANKGPTKVSGPENDV